ncbi:uncharacterized protein LOC143710965 [Siphateles boraxobius]|uniref:uncharacterized protein LOC143710965 n=1 Tax=Siphateles boraxobius TaxID=180520 RepID=UPI00406303E5
MSFVRKHLKMHFLHSFLMLVFVISDEGTLEFIVGGSGPLVAPLGGSVVLPCYVETPLVKEELTVEWRRTDSETLVHLYEDGESRPEVQQQDYHDRAHFFTDQIQHGNFSLRLDNLRAEDKGVYRCKVYSQKLANKTLVEIKDVEYLEVSGSSRSISASVGEDVTLNCSVDSHIKPEHIEELSWKRTDGDIMVLLYQDNEALPDSSDEQYRDRVEFFTDEIPKGNFSLRLKSVRTEDKGVYMCEVFAGRLSANTTVVLERLGFSVHYITVLILCIIASGSALLFLFRPENGETRMYLQVSLFLCPYITMLLASIIWRVIEGSLYETVCCCVLYILSPQRSFWVTPLATAVPDTILKYIMIPHAYHAVCLAVMYSVLFAEHFEDIDPVIRTVFFCTLVLVCLLFIIQLAKEKMSSCSGVLCRLVATCSFSLLPSLQLALLLYTRVSSSTVFIITVLPVLPVIHYFIDRTRWINRCFEYTRKCVRPGSVPLHATSMKGLYLSRLIWSMMIVMSGAMVYFYIMLLRIEKEGAGLVCVAGILQVLWVLAFSEVPVHYLNLPKRKMFLFVSAGLVLVNSVALMIEAIMNAVNGKRLMGDLRVVAVPSEWLFSSVPLLVLSMLAHWKPDSTEFLEDSQSPDSKGTPAPDYVSIEVNEKKGESHEMETLGEVAGNCEEQEEEINL